MNKPLSLVQELRNIKKGSASNQTDAEDLLSEIREMHQQCKADVAEAQRILEELRGVVSGLSPAGQPGDAHETDNEAQSGLKSLRDHSQNEIEAFRSSVMAELSEWLRGQSHAILDPVQQEISNRMNDLVEEFRARSQARLEAEQGSVPEPTKHHIEELFSPKSIALKSGSD